MKLDAQDSILATVLYADIFNWPLSRRELILWAIKSPMRLSSHTTGGIQRTQGGFYVVKGKSRLTFERLKREEWALQKWNIAKRTGTWLRLIPSLRLVGVTGGLSRNNVKDIDDIDLFCITARDTMWVSRLLAISIVGLLGLRRKPGDTKVKNKICLNMFMSEDAVHIPKEEQDLFTAYEVLQMTPIWERNGMYKKFLDANRWVSRFLPNAWEGRIQSTREKERKSGTLLSLLSTHLLSIVEPLARGLELWYMHTRRTTEVIRPGLLRFHPRDARVWVREAFRSRLARFNLPLDKIFYDR